MEILGVPIHVDGNTWSFELFGQKWTKTCPSKDNSSRATEASYKHLKDRAKLAIQKFYFQEILRENKQTGKYIVCAPKLHKKLSDKYPDKIVISNMFASSVFRVEGDLMVFTDSENALYLKHNSVL